MFCIQTIIGKDYHWLKNIGKDYIWTMNKKEASTYQTRADAMRIAVDAIELYTTRGFANLDIEVVPYGNPL